MKSCKTLAVVLNWNGWEDTLECCRSLAKGNLNEMDVLVFDNGSTNESVEKLRGHLTIVARSLAVETKAVGATDIKLDVFELDSANFKLYECPENLGFAKGCNFAARYAKAAGYENIIFLNNDTVLEENALSYMLETLAAKEPCGVRVVIPQIRYYDKPDTIWNCGGEVSYWGKVKYYYARALASEISLPNHLFVGFGTGCCFLCKVDFFTSIGGFTEKFFFGEEDIEFSFRMKRLEYKVICDTRALVLHKVGASLKGDSQAAARKAYVHLLNRLVNVKAYMPFTVWCVWSLLVCLRFFFSRSYDFPRPLMYVLGLYIESFKVQSVGKDRFREIIELGPLKNGKS